MSGKNSRRTSKESPQRQSATCPSARRVLLAPEVEQFLQTNERWEEGYNNAYVSYFGTREAASVRLIRARIFLFPTGDRREASDFDSQGLLAGTYPLSMKSGSLRAVATDLASGVLHTPTCALTLEPYENGRFQHNLQEYHPEGGAANRKLSVLQVIGGPRPDWLLSPSTSWQLRAGNVPFNDLAELLAHFGTGDLQNAHSLVEFVAWNVAWVDTQSDVQTNRARAVLNIADGLDTNRARLGYKVQVGGRIASQGFVDGPHLSWSRQKLETPPGEFLQGVATLEVPEGSIVQLFASYSGTAQTALWIADQNTIPNPRALLYREIDRDFKELNASLFELERARGDGSEAFERGVARLLWMYGFSVLHPGKKGSAETSDIFAFTPANQLAIVECTTDILDKKDKLAKLVARSETIRVALQRAAHSYLRALPVIVTALSREQVKADISKAATLGVVVVTREDLDQAVKECFLVQDADRWIDRARASLDFIKPAQLTNASQQVQPS